MTSPFVQIHLSMVMRLLLQSLTDIPTKKSLTKPQVRSGKPRPMSKSEAIYKSGLLRNKRGKESFSENDLVSNNEYEAANRKTDALENFSSTETSRNRTLLKEAEANIEDVLVQFIDELNSDVLKSSSSTISDTTRKVNSGHKLPTNSSSPTKTINVPSTIITEARPVKLKESDLTVLKGYKGNSSTQLTDMEYDELIASDDDDDDE